MLLGNNTYCKPISLRVTTRICIYSKALRRPARKKPVLLISHTYFTIELFFINSLPVQVWTIALTLRTSVSPHAQRGASWVPQLGHCVL